MLPELRLQTYISIFKGISKMSWFLYPFLM